MKYRNEKAICNTALALSKHATPSAFNWVNKQCPYLSARILRPRPNGRGFITGGALKAIEGR